MKMSSQRTSGQVIEAATQPLLMMAKCRPSFVVSLPHPIQSSLLPPAGPMLLLMLMLYLRVQAALDPFPPVCTSHAPTPPHPTNQLADPNAVNKSHHWRCFTH